MMDWQTAVQVLGVGGIGGILGSLANSLLAPEYGFFLEKRKAKRQQKIEYLSLAKLYVEARKSPDAFKYTAAYQWIKPRLDKIVIHQIENYNEPEIRKGYEQSDKAQRSANLDMIWNNFQPTIIEIEKDEKLI